MANQYWGDREPDPRREEEYRRRFGPQQEAQDRDSYRRAYGQDGYQRDEPRSFEERHAGGYGGAYYGAQGYGSGGYLSGGYGGRGGGARWVGEIQSPGGYGYGGGYASPGMDYSGASYGEPGYGQGYGQRPFYEEERQSDPRYVGGRERRYEAGRPLSERGYHPHYNRDRYTPNPREGRGYGGRDFWDRASDEVSSWFGDEDARRRRRWDAAEGGRHRGRGPKGYRRSDERIREDVSDHLTEDPFLDASEIEVAVSGGEVTLSGLVQSREDKRRAERCAEYVTGVDNVQNNLRINREGPLGRRDDDRGPAVGDNQKVSQVASGRA